MKKIYAIAMGAILTFAISGVSAQEWNTGVDLYSSYIWRGSKFGTGAAIQPTIEFSKGGFAIGAWGSVSTGGWDGAFETDDNGTTTFVGSEAFEADLYASYSFGFGLTLAVTDYYFGGDYFGKGSHFFEPSIGFEAGNFSLLGAYMLGDGVKDAYAEASYSFGSASLFVGAGNGQYTKDGKFMLCNVGIGTTKEIKVSDSFSIPVSGSVTLNPSTQGFFLAVGLSF